MSADERFKQLGFIYKGTDRMELYTKNIESEQLNINFYYSEVFGFRVNAIKQEWTEENKIKTTKLRINELEIETKQAIIEKIREMFEV